MRFVNTMVPRRDLPVLQDVTVIRLPDRLAIGKDGVSLFTLSVQGLFDASPPVTEVNLVGEAAWRDGQTVIFPWHTPIQSKVWVRGGGSDGELYVYAVVPVGHKVMVLEGSRAGQVWIRTANGWEPDPARRKSL